MIGQEPARLLREKQELKIPQGAFPEEAEALPAESELVDGLSTPVVTDSGYL